LSWSVYRQVTTQPNLGKNLMEIRQALTGPEAWKLLVIFLLMFVNWGLETRKWQLLLKHLYKISFWEAFKAILSGLAFALNTPNRIGEYGGRVLFIPDGKRVRAVSLTLAGSFSQLLVTLILGGVGLFFLSDKITASAEFSSLQVWITVLEVLVFFIALVGCIIYFRLSWLVKLVEKIPGVQAYMRHFDVLRELNVTILLNVMFLSFLRFLVFIIQYNLMLQMMQVEMGWWSGFWAVSVLFLLLATLPTIALLELGLRWEYSIMLFGLFSANVLGIYAAATGIWLINLVFPALAGSLFMLSIRIFK
jgi:uncharacterized membrane protein YbhN (UPF0104 family)